ncbi:MAG: alkaline shock response membrane anchor protein AmaP [Candidatus Omnitrophota bacterium]|nr:alkaline shock response membrane anchor protein AmaP [Candidatus Omnitrophota bacterium]MBU1929110.1 alkaline shock response membrane anchor protein AmaP [Candidatus Omnitrophota bacterium]MBU1929139.1 alkaline shock response membrane anchor protein AmaP [Candidatus Omnitrophota bacterium]MBU2035019.1 alkaline shock response membrane anchor protein AmaP [Candidatus Omnitrophota bacterium]MBU2222019.1 alkaline shock response membrane anchor protein AmaP [Candidatus Omnitrophota bacterium]
MRVFTVVFYTIVLILIGISMVLFSLALTFNFLDIESISKILGYIHSNMNIRIILGGSGLALVLISISFAQVVLGRFQREKTIAFSTASGEVTIALSAIEDLLKHFIFILPEIKELKPDVIAGKKGILVNLRVVLKSEANLPELTARLQEMTRSKIQEVLGVEEEIITRIHIAKIISRDEKDKKRKELEKEETTIPFGGYGRA